MNTLESFERRAEHEIELIEQDDSMSVEEKRVAIKEIYNDLKRIARKYEEDTYT